MEIKEYLDNFSKIPCGCGKVHSSSVKDIIVKSGAILELTRLIEEFGVKKPFVLADANTFLVAGKRVLEILDGANIKNSTFTFKEKELKPDDCAIEKAKSNFDNSCDLVIAVGSGVINDLGKIVAHEFNLPYFIVGTAPSMDGYASATSSVEVNGLKVSLNTKCAEVIIGDIDILKNAPEKMLVAGLGDMLAKYISLAEWKIASEIVGEYYCERVADLVRTALKTCVDNAGGLLKRDEKAVKAVFEGLVIGGVAMAYAGASRPASGVEHYFSHIFDMRSLEFNTKVDFHGIQCAVATLLSAKLYEKVLLLTPNKEKALASVKEFNYQKYKRQLKAFLGKSALAMVELEKTEKKYCKRKHKKRLEIILQKWERIKEIIKSEIPTAKALEDLFDLLGAPKTFAEIGIDADLYFTFLATKDIRDKYVLSRLLWDLGETEIFYD
ncbi:MAG: sn-glycerol-1-phosphate dehydrogenase [Clostridia bacterium]|nr:sn-glycerol-1-phosphate dehydrogenase [Clostridia bacterium]